MRPTNIVTYIVFPLLVFAFIAGCSNNNSIMGNDPNSLQSPANVPTPNPGTNSPIIKATGTVEYISLEGGFWGIVADDSSRYEPTNLSPKFMQKGLHVQFAATISKTQYISHMWGVAIDITSMSLQPAASPNPGGTNHP